MRLNGWQRIGVVVATVCWMAGGSLLINSFVINELGAPTSAEYSRCLDSRSVETDGTIPRDTSWGPCNARFSPAFIEAVANHWYYAAAFTLIPIPIVWLLVYMLVGLVRWIRAGREPKTN